MTVPADQGLRVVQTVESGESKQYVTDYLELDLAFWVVDWKHLKDGSPLGNNADWKGYKDTKSRYVMQVESIDDSQGHPHWTVSRVPRIQGCGLHYA